MIAECSHPTLENTCLKCGAVRDSADSEWRRLTDIERKRNVVFNQTAMTFLRELNKLTEAEQVFALADSCTVTMTGGSGAAYSLTIKRLGDGH